MSSPDESVVIDRSDAMTQANDFATSETLKNGVSVRIRAVRPTDKAGFVEAFG